MKDKLLLMYTTVFVHGSLKPKYTFIDLDCMLYTSARIGNFIYLQNCRNYDVCLFHPKLLSPFN